MAIRCTPISNSQGNISTTTSPITTTDTPLERSSIAHPIAKSSTQNLLKRLSYIVLSEGSRGLWTQRESPSFLACGAVTKFILSWVDSLSSCRHLLYIFRDVSSYYSNAVSEVAAAAHACRSLDREKWPKSKRWVTSYGCSDIIFLSHFQNESICLSIIKRPFQWHIICENPLRKSSTTAV